MFDQFLFYSSALLTLGGALAVSITRNLMHACLYLLATFMGVAGLYATLGADFLAATQLVVYAGGVVILMLFAIMLTGGIQGAVNRLGIEKVPSMGNRKTFIFALVTAAVMLSILVKIFMGLVGVSAPEELPPYEPTVEKIGILLVSDHVLVFEISSVLLLGVLVGAAVIARPRRS